MNCRVTHDLNAYLTSCDHRDAIGDRAEALARSEALSMDISSLIEHVCQHADDRDAAEREVMVELIAAIEEGSTLDEEKDALIEQYVDMEVQNALEAA